MIIIPADYNAATEAGHLRLSFDDSQDALRAAGKQAGDWVWLSDGEVLVGAQLADDDTYGVVAIPDWETLVHLDDEEARDIERVGGKLQLLLNRSSRTVEEEVRVFQLLSQFDHFAPRLARDATPGHLAFRRAAALLAMGKPDLALIETQDARLARPGHPADDFLYLDILRRVAPDRAVTEAARFAEDDRTPAAVLAAAINILADRAEGLPEDQFTHVALHVIELCNRFENSPGRPNISASLLSLVHFNRGMILLRMDRLDDARRALTLAHAIAPLDEALDEAARLVAHDEHARELAARIRSRPRAA